MECYDSLVSAIENHAPTDTRRIYRVRPKTIRQGEPDSRYVIATSPAQAALAVIGEDNVSLVSRTERYAAMQQALAAAIERQNAKVDGKGAK